MPARDSTLTRFLLWFLYVVTLGKSGQRWKSTHRSTRDEISRQASELYLRREGSVDTFRKAKGPQKEPDESAAEVEPDSGAVESEPC